MNFSYLCAEAGSGLRMTLILFLCGQKSKNVQKMWNCCFKSWGLNDVGCSDSDRQQPVFLTFACPRILFKEIYLSCRRHISECVKPLCPSAIGGNKSSSLVFFSLRLCSRDGNARSLFHLFFFFNLK